MRKKGDSAVKLISACLLLQVISTQAIDPDVEGSLNGLKFVQSVLVLGELLNGAMCHVVDKAITHVGNPDELV
ncbi:hypothetical protein HG531_003495 [Fusarium graminearum]|nr:hypothetical protein HG531_003495 [Fusarium graminearum]